MSAPTESLRPLLDLVRVRPGYDGVARALLGNVFLVDDLDAALAIWRGGEAAWTLVTPAGETLAASGVVAGGSERSEETLLAQRRELRLLDGEVERRDVELAAARLRYEELTASMQQRESALRDVDAELAQVAMGVVAAEKDVQRGRQEISDLQEQHRVAARELEEASAQLTARREEARQLEDRRQQAMARRQECEAPLRRGPWRAERREAANRLHEAQTSRRIALAESQARRDALIMAIERLQRSDEETQRRAAGLLDRQNADRSTLEQTRIALAEAVRRINELDQATAASNEALSAAEAELSRLREVRRGPSTKWARPERARWSTDRASVLDLQSHGAPYGARAPGADDSGAVSA